jgi:hypothetical protein
VQTFGIRLLKTNGFFMPNASNCEGRASLMVGSLGMFGMHAFQSWQRQPCLLLFRKLPERRFAEIVTPQVVRPYEVVS